VSTVLVTGGSGFVGSHAILQLLAAGHRVRTTVRSLSRESGVREMLKDGGAEGGDSLAFFAADLERDEGWAESIAGCDYVLHVASPFPRGTPKNEDELIIPAREGTLRVLRTARDAGVKRVVMTSSFAAVGYGHQDYDRVFNEADWTNLEGRDVQPYIKSKVLAERAAWDFMAKEGGTLELSVVNPVGIFGPVLGPDYSSSIALIKGLMDGMPAVPRMYFGIVDVRDLVDLHLRAMTAPAAKGERFIAVGSKTFSLLDVAKILKQRLGPRAAKVPNRQLPDWVVRISAMFNTIAKSIVPNLGVVRRSTSEKAQRILGWTSRPTEQTLVDTAESLIRHNLVRS
jgi:dihydroflavonol-4-reductase